MCEKMEGLLMIQCVPFVLGFKPIKMKLSTLVDGFCGRGRLQGRMHLLPEGNFSVAFASLLSQGRTFKNLGFNPKRVDFFLPTAHISSFSTFWICLFRFR